MPRYRLASLRAETPIERFRTESLVGFRNILVRQVVTEPLGTGGTMARYFIHITADRLIEYDDEGSEFAELADARAHAIEFISLAYMLADDPPTRKLC